MIEEERILVQDEEGNEKEYVVLTSFESEKTAKTYVVCYQEAAEISREIELVPFILNANAEPKFVHITDEADLQEVERVLNEMVKLSEGELANE